MYRNPARKATAKTAPMVPTTGLFPSSSTLANHVKPVRTITGPSRLSGRARQESSPLPMNDQPTSRTMGRLGIFEGCTTAWLATQETPAPASRPSPPSAISLAFSSRCCALSATVRQPSW
jgi:hypothetical protein